MAEWWEYEQLQSGAPYDWSPAGRGGFPDDNVDFHLDLGAGKLPKGRLRIDRHGDAEILMDLNTMEVFDSKGPLTQVDGGLPFPDNSIHSIVTHHCLEHIGDGFLHLMDECYRVMKPGALFRIIVPLFPSFAAVSDPDHVRYFTHETFNMFVGEEGQDFWSDVFAEPYTKARFKLGQEIYTPAPSLAGGNVDADSVFQKPREARVSLWK